LVPADVLGYRHHQICFAHQGLAVRILLSLGGRHHPHVTVVVAAEFAFRIWSIRRWGEEARSAERAHEILVVVAENGIELFDRPRHIDWSEVHVVCRERLAIGASIIGDRGELLVAFGVHIAANLANADSGVTLM